MSQATKLLLISIHLLISVLYLPSSFASECTNKIAVLDKLQGRADVKLPQTLHWQPISEGHAFCPGDRMRVDDYSTAVVHMGENNKLRLSGGSALTFNDPKQSDDGFLKLLRGVFFFFIKDPNKLEVTTPFYRASVDGTEFTLEVTENGGSAWVLEGQVRLSNRLQTKVLTAGQATTVSASGIRPLIIKDVEAVQWALYYPPILSTDYDFGDNQSTTDRNNTLFQKALQAYNEFRLSDALTTIEQISDDNRDADFYNARAAFRLSVGQVEPAKDDIQASLRLRPENAQALALQSIIRLVANDKSSALKLAERAVNQNPQLPAAHIARSYAQQSAFDIADALTSAKLAADLAPTDARIWARVSELLLMEGDFPQALIAAEKGMKTAPGLPRSKTILGFAHLAAMEVANAQQAFTDALSLTPKDPLPHFGLGLTKIRQGDLLAGRQSLERAVLFDPMNALYRSYLGKAYFEENRPEEASKQFELAKQLDPNDPTGWFYEAFLLHSLNQPAEAIESLSAAIEKNNNRAIYRSRQLLDQDLAARTVSLGHFYQNLGFEEMSKHLATQALVHEPGSYSAHRMLADSYQGHSNLDSARLSELLQAQLLQPLALHPLQPQLSETGSGLLDDNAPGTVGFNEYNALFLQNGTALQTDIMLAENGQYASDLIVAGLFDKVALSAGTYQRELKGQADKSNFKEEIAVLFAQLQPSINTGLQLEYKLSVEDKHGNVAQTFLPASDLFKQQVEIEDELIRLGMNHRINNHARLLASVIQHERDITNYTIQPRVLSDRVERTTDVNLYELQYQSNSKMHTIQAGVSHFTKKTDSLLLLDFETLDCPFPLSGPDCQFSLSKDEQQQRFYYYQHMSPISALDTTLAATWVHTDLAAPRDSDSLLLPKLGLRWQINPHTTLRTAFFATYQALPDASTFQSLEPTHVVGFNQVIDEPEQTRSYNYAIGLSHQPRPDINIGAEWVYRDIQTPFSVTSHSLNAPPISTVQQISGEGHSLSMFANWLISPQWSISMHPQFEHLKRNETLSASESLLIPDGVQALDTLQIPLTVSWFHRSGLSAKLRANYNYQEGLFQPPNETQQAQTPQLIEDSDNFWMIDLTTSYRLPKRQGMLSLGVKNLLDTAFNFQDVGSYDAQSNVIESSRPSRLSAERYLFTEFSLYFR